MAGVVGALMYLYCRSGCSGARVAAALTFHPPNPPFYEIGTNAEGQRTFQLRLFDEDADEAPTTSPAHAAGTPPHPPMARDDDEAGVALRQVAADKEGRQQQPPRVVAPAATVAMHADMTVDVVSTSGGGRVPVLLLRTPGARYTVLHSHGNATDLGGMYELYAEMARELGVSVLGYDYSGYGAATGIPTEANTYRDIEAVYRWALDHAVEGGDPTRLVLYGQSVGSGPSCWLASRERVGGLVLHSPILSGLRVLTESRLLGCCDIYPNLHRISRVTVPVMVIHGRQDEEVGFDHGVRLLQCVPTELQAEPYWVEGKGHNDIVMGEDIPEYYRRLRRYLQMLQARG